MNRWSTGWISDHPIPPFQPWSHWPLSATSSWEMLGSWSTGSLWHLSLSGLSSCSPSARLISHQVHSYGGESSMKSRDYMAHIKPPLLFMWSVSVTLSTLYGWPNQGTLYSIVRPDRVSPGYVRLRYSKCFSSYGSCLFGIRHLHVHIS